MLVKVISKIPAIAGIFCWSGLETANTQPKGWLLVLFGQQKVPKN
jgi:hypothetical protein